MPEIARMTAAAASRGLEVGQGASTGANAQSQNRIGPRLPWLRGILVPERYRAETRAMQLQETLQVIGYSAMTHVAVAAAFVLLFWDRPQRLYVEILFFAVSAFSVPAISAARLWALREQSKRSVGLGLNVSAFLAFGIGVAWGTMPIALFLPSDSDHRMLVVATTAGLIADVYALGPTMLVCMAYVAPLLVGAFIGINLSGQLIGIMLSLLLGVYTCFVFVSSKVLTRLSLQRIVDRVRVSEQHDTIGLLLRDFEENASDWLWEVDAGGRLRHVSRRMAQAADCAPEHLEGLAFEALLRGSRPDGSLSHGAKTVLGAIGAGQPLHDQLVELELGATRRFWRLSGRPVFEKGGALAGYRGVGADATEACNAQARIAFMARHDALTGLMNRAAFMETVKSECGAAAVTGTPRALLYCDLDGFKAVNDSYGHPAGDELLRQVARRLIGASPPGAMTCRLGGDEFALLFPIASTRDVGAAAETIVDAIEASFDVFGSPVGIGISIGAALTPADAVTPDDLLMRADMALYRAKTEGRGTCRRFVKAYETSLVERREIETDLRLAQARGEFELRYQPLIDLASGRVACFEALLRWSSPSRGLVSPTEFIPIAEAIDLIVPIGQWVLLRACKAAAGWDDGVDVAVNISPRHFKRPDFVSDVVLALETSGLAPERLEIEITEGVFLDNSATAIENMHALRRRGVRIALDDFGTGFSSLNYLINFPVDKIKIDRSFIADPVEKAEGRAVVKAILALAKELCIRTTAEGVETRAQLDLVGGYGCEEVQGYFFSQPLVLDEAEAFASRRSRPAFDRWRRDYRSRAVAARV